ncbi:hypothetical protein PsW64_03767 [Pseudovibrio sp. W64]|nr:hypothetical protein PsW64_03767 [Pseudovibrio sp. W64]
MNDLEIDELNLRAKNCFRKNITSCNLPRQMKIGGKNSNQ